MTKKNKVEKLILNPLPFLKLSVVSAIASLTTITCILLIQKTLPQEIPLFYGLAEGQDQLVSSNWLLIPGLTSLAVTLLNITLSLILDDKFLKQSLTLSAFVVNIFLITTTIKIVLLVGNF